MMGAVWMRVRSAWRRRTGSLITFTLLVALCGVVVMTAFAGARRTHSVPGRFVRVDGTPDVVVGLQDLGSMRGVDAIRHQPEVARVGVAVEMSALPLANDPSAYMPLLAPTDDIFGSSIWRGILIAGRRPDPRAPDEIVLSEAHARLLEAHVGDQVPLIAFDQHQAEACLRADQPAAWCRSLSRTPRLKVRVVGVVRTGIDLNGRVQDVSFSTLSRGFFERHRSDIAWNPVLMVKLRSGAAATSFTEHARAALGGDQADITAFNNSAIVDAVDVLSTALLLFALVAAVAAAFAIGQTVVRQVASDAHDRVTLAALGTTRLGRAFDAAAPLGIAAGAGALLALGGACVASTWMPIGLARRAEAVRGFDFDAVVLGLGALILVVFVVIAAVIGSSALARSGRGSKSKRPMLATRVAAAPVSPSTSIGLRNALGGTRDAVPVRAAFGGIAAATAGVVAVIVFGAGLHHLVRTPALYGWGWDAMDIQYSEQNLTRLLADPDVADIAMIDRRAQATVAGHPTLLLAITPVKGSMQPTLVSGRLPQAADEVALGRDTLAIAHAQVGDHVSVEGSKAGRALRVVGIATFATSGDGDPLAEGAVLTPAAKQILMGSSFSDERAGQRNYAVRFRPGLDRASALARLEQAIPANRGRPAFTAPSPPAEVQKLRQIESLPRWLAAFLAALGLLAISHASFVGVRRRGRDFSILRAIGFRPRDVRTSIAFEALVLAVCGALIGIPLGIVLGRFAWQNVAAGIGVPVAQRIEIVALLAAVPIAALVALGAALIPGRRAARARPGEILRME